jgi:hypothetical protein
MSRSERGVAKLIECLAAQAAMEAFLPECRRQANQGLSYRSTKRYLLPILPRALAPCLAAPEGARAPAQAYEIA